MKKSEIKKLDKLFSDIIRSLGHCEINNCQNSNLNTHHIVGRRNFTLRWDRQNGCCLCASHHTFARESAHQDSEWFHDWLEENRPEDLIYIAFMRNKVLKQTYEEVIERLNETIL